MCRTKTHKFIQRLYEQDELYDLVKDPLEEDIVNTPMPISWITTVNVCLNGIWRRVMLCLNWKINAKNRKKNLEC